MPRSPQNILVKAHFKTERTSLRWPISSCWPQTRWMNLHSIKYHFKFYPFCYSFPFSFYIFLYTRESSFAFIPLPLPTLLAGENFRNLERSWGKMVNLINNSFSSHWLAAWEWQTFHSSCNNIITFFTHF